MKTLTTAQLAEYLQVTKRTVQRRSVRESWSYRTEIGLGGERKLYIFECLPPAVKHLVVANIVAKHEQVGLSMSRNSKQSPLDSLFDLKDNHFIVLEKYDPAHWITQHIFAHELDASQLNKAYIRQGLLVLAKLYVLCHKVHKIAGFDQFCQLYNTHALALHADVYKMINQVSRISLLRWEKQLTTGELTMIKNEQLLDETMIEMIEEVLLISPNISARQLRQHFVTLFNDRKPPSELIFAQYIEQYKHQQQGL